MLNRTKEFATAVWFLCRKIPNNREYNAYVRQLIRSSSSVGANYRASQRAKSTADFINKLKIVEEESDESIFFLELLRQVNPKIKDDIDPLLKEGNEILSIVVASIKTSRRNSKIRTS